MERWHLYRDSNGQPRPVTYLGIGLPTYELSQIDRAGVMSDKWVAHFLDADKAVLAAAAPELYDELKALVDEIDESTIGAGTSAIISRAKIALKNAKPTKQTA